MKFGKIDRDDCYKWIIVEDGKQVGQSTECFISEIECEQELRYLLRKIQMLCAAVPRGVRIAIAKEG